MNEICQLNVDDIQSANGIWLMNINAKTEDKSIKTQSGTKLVLIHPKLLKLGFLDYVDQVRNEK